MSWKLALLIVGAGAVLIVVAKAGAPPTGEIPAPDAALTAGQATASTQGPVLLTTRTPATIDALLQPGGGRYLLR